MHSDEIFSHYKSAKSAIEIVAAHYNEIHSSLRTLEMHAGALASASRKYNGCSRCHCS